MIGSTDVNNNSLPVRNTSETEKLRRELKRVREENRKLKHIISYGNMSALETLIDQYMDYSRIHLKKIAIEIQLTDYENLTKDAAKKLQTMLKTEKLTEKFGHQTVQINISTILPLEGGHSYQIRWTEETFTISNGENKVTPYSGIFTVQTIRSDDETKLLVNPIGMYISDFSWSKDASAVNTESTTNVNKK